MNINDVDPSAVQVAPPPSPAAGAPTNINQIDPNAVQTEQEYNEATFGTPGQQVLTGLEGAAQGIAGPLAPAAEVATGLTTPENIRLRSEVNPVIHGLSEAGGFAGSLALGEGLAPLVGKVGEAAKALTGLEGATAISKIAQTSVKGAAEMAALQAGDEVTKMIVQDPNQSLGTAAINVGLSGILGGAGGAVLGSVSPLWKATVGDRADGILNLLKNKMDGLGVPVDTDFQAFLDTAEADGVNIPPEVKAGLVDNPTVQNIFKTLRESGSSSSEALLGAIEQAKTTAQDQISKVLGENGPTAFEAGEQAKASILDRAEQLNNDVKNKYDAISDSKLIEIPDEPRIKLYDNLIKTGQEFGSVGGPAQNLFKTFAERALAQNTSGQLDKLLTEIGSEGSVAWRSGDFEKWRALSTIKDSIRDFQDEQISQALARIAKPVPQGGQPGMYQQLLDISGEAEHQQLASELLSQRKTARASYRDFIGKLSDMASLGKAGKVKSYTQFAESIGKIPSAKLADRLFDEKNIEGLRKLQGEYPEVFDKLVQQQKSDILESSTKQGVLNHNTVLNKINSLPKEVKNLIFKPEELKGIESAHGVIRELNSRINPSGTAGTLNKLWAKMPAGAGAVLGMLSGHGAFSGAIMGEVGHFLGSGAPDMAKLALLKLLGSGKPVQSEALKGIFDYFRAAAKGDKLLTNAAKNLFQGSAEILPQGLMPDKRSRDRLEKSLSSLNTNPENAMKVAGNLGYALPDHATAAGTIAAAATGYLNTLKPTQPVSSPLDTPPPIEPGAQAAYDRALDVAQQPLMVLQWAKRGTLQAQDVQTLNTIYPSLHNRIVDEMNKNLIEARNDGKTIPYDQKLGMSLLMGSPLDSTMGQPALQTIMAANAPRQMPPPPGKPAKKPSNGALDRVDKVAAMYQNPLEAREADKREA
jgi:hypothetical protein